jgi:hypothetical protein
MRILPIIAPQEGYEPSSVERNQEEGNLMISHPAQCQLEEESKLIAEILVLRCVLKPLPLKEKDLKVHLISEEEPLTPALLYDEKSIAFGYDREGKDSRWQAIALEYTGVGHGIHQGKPFGFFGKTLPSGQIEESNPLYIKPFKTEHESYKVQTTTLASGQVLTSPPGVLDTQVLRGYGGYYKEGVPLEEIQQIYYSLTSTHKKTRVRLISSSKLQEQKTPPPQGGKGVLFSPAPLEEEYLTLPGAIAAGYARLLISTDWGISQFKSFFCEPISGYPSFINVHFKP